MALRPAHRRDTSVTGFVIRALAAAQKAGLKVPPRTLAQAERFLDSVTKENKEASYLPGTDATPAMTAGAAYSRLLLGANPRGAAVAGAVKSIRAKLPGGRPTNLYLTYYATRVLYAMGGEGWDKWNAGKVGFRDQLVKAQDDGVAKAGNAGSWRGDDQVGGRLGATSFALLTLLVYHEGRGTVAKPEP